MVSSNTETNITVAYQDADGTLDFVVDAAQPNVTSLGTLTSLRVDDVVIDGTTIGHADDTDLITLTSGVVTVAGELDAVSLDISGDADIDGTLEADAITIGGITLAETISDTVGAMVTSNTESGITVAYQDADNTLDFTIGTLNQDTTGLAGTATTLATARTIGGVSFNGSANIDLPGVNSAGNQNTSGTAATVTGAAQTNITSLGTLTALTVDDITINGSVISDGGALDITSGADMLLDSEGDIIFDANGANFKFKDDNTPIFELNNSSGDLEVFVNTADKDIKFGGNDSGSTITAMTIDMSAAGMVGIGTTGPSAKLDVVTNDNVYAAEFVQSNTSNGDGAYVQIGSTAAADYAFNVRSDAGNTQIIAAKGDGKVGIGVASPVTGLTVASSTNITQQPLATSGTTISWNALTHANAFLIPSANLTIDLPTNPIEGAIISVEIAMNGTPRTIAWHTVFEFAASTAPTATATANKTDIFSFRYNGSVWQEIGRVQNMAQT